MKTKEQYNKEIEKRTKMYIQRMAKEMQRFANDVFKLKELSKVEKWNFAITHNKYSKRNNAFIDDKATPLFPME